MVGGRAGGGAGRVREAGSGCAGGPVVAVRPGLGPRDRLHHAGPGEIRPRGQGNRGVVDPGRLRGGPTVQLRRGQGSTHLTQPGGELGPVAGPPGGVTVRGHRDQLVELLGNARDDRAGGRHLGVDMLVGHVDRRLALEGLAAREQLEEDQARGVDVAAGVRGAVLDLLGRQVGDGPQDGAARRGRRLRGQRAGEPEVGHLDLTVLADDDVLRLDVPVHDAGPVGQAQRLGDRDQQVQRGTRGERCLGLDDLAQRATAHQLHDEEHVHPVGALVVDRDDARVVEAGRGSRLTSETVREGLVVGEPGPQQLDRHRALQPLVERLPHRGHPAVGDMTHQPVASVEDTPGLGAGVGVGTR